jgi:hypothetical protein
MDYSTNMNKTNNHLSPLSPGTPASSTTKISCHDIAEILLKVVLRTKNQSINHLLKDRKDSIFSSVCSVL